MTPAARFSRLGFPRLLAAVLTGLALWGLAAWRSGVAWGQSPATARPATAPARVAQKSSFDAVDLKPALRPGMKAPHASDSTPCAACHVTASWSQVSFPHEKTGFPLRFAHERTTCKSCHPVNFELTVPSSCSGCHPDVHAGELGVRCEGCHDESGWQSRFNADAHRGTGFPLIGRHAALPCQECHPAATGRRFVARAAQCVGCHQREYDRTVGTAVDHARLRFSSNCRQCHGVWAFKPGGLPEHDVCFQLSGGPHARVGCQECHTAIPNSGVVAACSSQTATCTSCHEHECAKSDKIHSEGAGVPGYQCKDRKCYECHRFSSRGAPQP